MTRWSARSDLEVVIPDLLDYLREQRTVLLAHNARFDVSFLSAALGKLGMERELPPAVCTVALANETSRRATVWPGVSDALTARTGSSSRVGSSSRAPRRAPRLKPLRPLCSSDRTPNAERSRGQEGCDRLHLDRGGARGARAHGSPRDGDRPGLDVDLNYQGARRDGAGGPFVPSPCSCRTRPSTCARPVSWTSRTSHSGRTALGGAPLGLRR